MHLGGDERAAAALDPGRAYDAQVLRLRAALPPTAGARPAAAAEVVEICGVYRKYSETKI